MKTLLRLSLLMLVLSVPAWSQLSASPGGSGPADSGGVPVAFSTWIGGASNLEQALLMIDSALPARWSVMETGLGEAVDDGRFVAWFGTHAVGDAEQTELGKLHVVFHADVVELVSIHETTPTEEGGLRVSYRIVSMMQPTEVASVFAEIDANGDPVLTRLDVDPFGPGSQVSTYASSCFLQCIKVAVGQLLAFPYNCITIKLVKKKFLFFTITIPVPVLIPGCIARTVNQILGNLAVCIASC